MFRMHGINGVFDKGVSEDEMFVGSGEVVSTTGNVWVSDILSLESFGEGEGGVESEGKVIVDAVKFGSVEREMRGWCETQKVDTG